MPESSAGAVEPVRFHVDRVVHHLVHDAEESPFDEHDYINPGRTGDRPET